MTLTHELAIMTRSTDHAQRPPPAAHSSDAAPVVTGHELSSDQIDVRPRRPEQVEIPVYAAVQVIHPDNEWAAATEVGADPIRTITVDPARDDAAATNFRAVIAQHRMPHSVVHGDVGAIDRFIEQHIAPADVKGLNRTVLLRAAESASNELAREAKIHRKYSGFYSAASTATTGAFSLAMYGTKTGVEFATKPGSRVAHQDIVSFFGYMGVGLLGTAAVISTLGAAYCAQRAVHNLRRGKQYEALARRLAEHATPTLEHV